MTLNATLSGITPAEPICIGCGQPFARTYVRQVRCRKGCGQLHGTDTRTVQQKHAARTEERAKPRAFIGVDGEGVKDPVTGAHHYVLLSVGEHHLSLDGAPLQFHEIMAFLWSCFELHPKAVFVGFYLGYDFAQWIRGLPEERARMLLDDEGKAKRKRKTGIPHQPPWPVRHLTWEFDYLAKKRFKLRPEGVPPKNTPKDLINIDDISKERTWKWMFINDAGSYFQTTFLKAIDPSNNPNPVCTHSEFDIIAAGKLRRENAEFDPAMVEYNQLECEILARLMQQLQEGIREEGLRLTREQWHGPGQVAQSWMKKIEIPKGDKVRDITPEAVRDAARGSYFGGWFEIFWHGLCEGDSYGYDINSAYPFVMSQLPCLMHGKWSHTQERSGGRLLTWQEKERLPQWGFVRAWVRGTSAHVGAMQHRNKDKTIVRPNQTAGWYVASELTAAIRAHLVKDVRVYQIWAYHPCDCAPPLLPLVDLYEGRLRVGKASPSGKARKLIYNSVAGKFQQSVGEPAYGNPIYGTWITAGCRSLILKAIASHPKGLRDLLMIATDGLVFRSPHPALGMHKSRLGAWDGTVHRNLSLFMPGVYWDDESRQRIAAGEAPAFKSRGIAAKDLHRHVEDLDTAWLLFSEVGWPRMELDVAFQLISPTQALARRKWELAGTVNNDKKRIISANPEAKRIATGPGKSAAWPHAAKLESLPYDGTFGDEARAFADSEFGDHPDGRIADILVETVLGNAR